MAKPYPTLIPGLRGPSETTGGLVYFGRMLDKIRLHAAGKLPDDWQPARGQEMTNSFDDRCCRFLGISYAAIEAETLRGGKSDDELLEWACFKTAADRTSNRSKYGTASWPNAAGATAARSASMNASRRSASRRERWRRCSNTSISTKAG